MKIHDALFLEHFGHHFTPAAPNTLGKKDTLIEEWLCVCGLTISLQEDEAQHHA